MQAILIDPLAKALSWVEIPQATYRAVMKDIIKPKGAFEFIYPPGRTTVIIVDDESLLHDDCNTRGYWMPFFNPQPVCGRGLIFGLQGPEGDLCECRLNIDQVRKAIEFVDVEFAGFEESQGEEEHPIFGKMAVYRREAIFRPKGPLQ